MSDDQLHLDSLVIHGGQTADPATGAVMPPISLASTYAQQSPGRHQGYAYARGQNPTRYALERMCARLESSPLSDDQDITCGGFAFASGMAAISTALELLDAGDHVIAMDDMYGGTHRLLNQVRRRSQGLQVSYVDMSDPQNIARAFTDRTRMLWVETPTNPLLKLADLRAVAALAAERGALSVCDNTFASPILQRPLECGFDLVTHSATKYLGGHSDVIGGILVTGRHDLAERLRFLQNAIGSVLGPVEAYLTLRGIKTLALRMERHCASAQRIAGFLEGHPRVQRVAYPCLPSHPQHALAERQMRLNGRAAGGGMVTLWLDGGLDESRRFLEHVRVFTLAESLGGVESLIEHPAIMTHASVPAETRRELGISDSLIRLSVGIEHPDDLIADLEQALAVQPVLRIDYASCMSGRIGDHGLAPGELDAALPTLNALTALLESRRGSGWERWRELPFDPLKREHLDAVEALAARHRDTENLIVLGIGGSALGTIALQAALNPVTYNLQPRPPRRGPRLFVLDNVDPHLVGQTLDEVRRSDPDFRRTLVNVISKSGETAETAAQFMVVRSMLEAALGRDHPRRIVAVTDPESGTMRAICDEQGIDTLPVPAGVGGRFSVLSPVGLFNAALCGIDVAVLLEGAAEMDRRCSSSDALENPAATLAWILTAHARRGRRNHVLMPYSNQLYALADWFRQLWAESLGKRYDLGGEEVHAGATPLKALGATDQHSQVQLYREGPDDKVIGLVEVDRFDADVAIPADLAAPSLRYLEGSSLASLLAAEKRATEYALTESGRPNFTISFPCLDARHVGQFIQLWQMTTAYAGLLLNVNAYDQPAVETGKKATFGLMGRPGYESWSETVRKTLLPTSHVIEQWSGPRGRAMPMYEYVCEEDGEVVTLLRSMAEADEPVDDPKGMGRRFVRCHSTFSVGAAPQGAAPPSPGCPCGNPEGPCNL